MKRIHLTAGLAVVFIFLLTGQYMEFLHVGGMRDGPRVLYRSRHIYLLMAGLVNIGVGLYFAYRRSGWRRKLQLAGSILMLISPVLILVGFISEPERGAEQTMIAAFGIFAVALGTFEENPNR